MWVSLIWAISIGIGGLCRRPGAAAKNEDALFRQQVGQAAAGVERIGLAKPVEGNTTFDPHADLVAERDKIADRAEMNVRGLVPRVGEAMSERYPPRQQKAEPDSPEAKIGKRDDRAAADADERLQNLSRLAGRLQGLAQYDHIEGLGRIGVEIAVGVALNDRKAVPDASIDARLADFDAPAIDVFVSRQIGQQGAIAATNVENS